MVEGDEEVPVAPLSKSKEEKSDLEVLVEILPAVNSGGGSSKWPHEVRRNETS